MRVIHVPTAGMSCSACSAIIERAVSSIRGVLSVTSSDVEAMTSVIYDERVSREEEIATAIRGAGFEARPRR